MICFFLQNSLYSFVIIKMVGDKMLDIINKLLWGIATIFLIGSGIYFTKTLNGVQFQIKKMFQGFKHKGNVKISPFQSLMMATAARIGVGSLAGVALAIHIGGIGTIFWLWISTILTVPNAFAESCLGVIYREKDDGFYKGGPSYYIDKGLGKKCLAKIYALLILISYIVGFLTIQSNTITKSLENVVNIPNIVVGIMIAILSGSIIIKGVRGIADATSKLVPVMGALFLLVSLSIIIKNISMIPSIFINIIKEAFNFKSLGIGVFTSFLIGLQRGIFSNEAGLGSGAIASSTADSNNPIGQGLIQILGIYFTSLVICSATAFIILTSNYQELIFNNINGIEITQYALTYHLGSFGNIILIVSIIMFAFSTILTGYYYGESNLKYLIPSISDKQILLLKIFTMILLVYGSIAQADFLWKIVDIFVALMAIINIYALINMRKDIIYEWNHYKGKSKL